MSEPEKTLCHGYRIGNLLLGHHRLLVFPQRQVFRLRTDHDFAVAWAKMYGKGRVFYSTLGHVEANWDKPEFQAMVTGAIKWTLRLVDADVTPRPAPSGGDR